MFKKSKRKIVAVILSVLILLLFGTFCVIYLASYVEMTNENQEMLKQYVSSYRIPEEPSAANPQPIGQKDRPGGRMEGPPLLELSTFYSAAVSYTGETLKTDTADLSTFSEEELTELALEIIENGKESGVLHNLAYRMEDKGSYILVAFLDNTVVLENAGTLFNYTLIFGSVALVLMFFLARYLADRIVAPLEESYQKQKQFISDAGHELKTPVAVINANLELLSREIGGNQWLSNIQYENERMSALIIQLLDLARAENTSPPMETLDLSRLVYGETLPFETVAYENGLTLTSQIRDNILVSGNSIQLKQLTSILIDNALRHSSAGAEVRLTLEASKNHAVLSVSNDGDPIAPEQRAHLFERFYRTDEARASVDGHYGLGLAIAKAITVTHKGGIDVQCRDGKVIFTARIPLQK